MYLKTEASKRTTGIYHLLSDLTPSLPTQSKPRHKAHNRQLKSVTERKKQLRKDFKKAKQMPQKKLLQILPNSITNASDCIAN